MLPGAAYSFFEEEVACHHRVDAGRVEAAHCVARGADERLAEEIERGVVKHRESGLFAEGVEKCPIQRVIFLRYSMHADRIAGENRATELLLVLRANGADAGEMARVRSGFEILRRYLDRHRCGEFARCFTVLDEGVEIFRGVRIA